jgi:hypothetical protein
MIQRTYSEYMTAKKLKIFRSSVYAYWNDVSYEPCPHCKKPINPWHFVRRN